MSWPITFEDVIAAEARLRPFLPITPLRNYAALDEATGLHVLVKHENHLPTCAFKVRNGLAALTAMTPEQRAHGVVAASTGNHGQGVAFAGQALGVKVTICVPVGANPEKVAAMRGFGATIIEHGKDYDEAIAMMKQIVREQGMIEVHGVNHPMMPAGAGTLTLEITQQARAMGEKIDAMVIAIGGGSQAVGAMTVMQKLSPNVQVFAVQAEGASTIHDAWQARRTKSNQVLDEKNKPHSPITGGPVRTFAEGLATRSTYDLTFDALCTGLAGFVTVTDPQMAAAMRLMLRATHNLCEPAGAASLAALFPLRDQLKNKTVVIVNCGANVDNKTLRRVLNEEI